MPTPRQRPELTFKLRRDEAADWTLKNPVLEDGEPGFEKDTLKLKIGDGVTPWNQLDYLASGNGGPIIVDGGASDANIFAHINDSTPHPVYDDGPSLLLLYQNAKV